jgi:hypothetical protein
MTDEYALPAHCYYIKTVVTPTYGSFDTRDMIGAVVRER